jgi:two-component system, NarL family, sensor kinase
MDAYQASIFTAVLIASVAFAIALFSLALMIARQQSRNYRRQLDFFLKEAELKEREQNRIAHDLHDELGPTLSLTRMQLQSLKDLEREDEIIVDKACQQIYSVGERLGGIARNLAPRVLMDKGLFMALRSFFDQFHQRQSMFIYFHYKVGRSITEDMSIHIYRMLQEMVHNAVKYAEARYIMVTIVEREDKLIIDCRDNGKGFEGGHSKGLGLESIRIRTSLLGGWVDLQTNAGDGTRYYIELPFHE